MMGFKGMEVPSYTLFFLEKQRGKKSTQTNRKWVQIMSGVLGTSIS